MFATPEYISKITGYALPGITLTKVIVAQEIIEAYVGRTEAEVDNANDEALLGKAVAYQTVYMVTNPDRVFDQVAASYIQSGQSSVSYKQGDEHSPWIAPLAHLACKNLSWRRTRSIHTGPIHKNARSLDWVRD